MELHLGLIALEVLCWVHTTIIQNQPRHFELRWKRSVLNLLRERRVHLFKPRQFNSGLDNINLLLELLYIPLHLVQGLGKMNRLVIIW